MKDLIENLKEYIKENKQKENIFYIGLKERTLEQKYQYIKEHCVYDIMSRWNNLESIANCIKVWNLKLTEEQIDKFFEIYDNDIDYIYSTLNCDIKNFEYITKTEVFFNGSSNGYLVMIPKFEDYKQWKNILDLFFIDNIYDYETLKEFKIDSLDVGYGHTNKDINKDLEKCYYLLKSFDVLCDLLRSQLINILNNYDVEEEEYGK